MKHDASELCAHVSNVIIVENVPREGVTSLKLICAKLY